MHGFGVFGKTLGREAGYCVALEGYKAWSGDGVQDTEGGHCGAIKPGTEDG